LSIPHESLIIEDVTPRYTIAELCTDLVYEIVIFNPSQSTENITWLTFVISKQQKSNILGEHVIISSGNMAGINIKLGRPHPSKQSE
jgi:hypothetical protein